MPLILDYTQKALNFLKRFKVSAIPIYESYECALAACQHEGYQNHDLVKVIVDKNIIYRRKMEEEVNFDLGALRTLTGVGLSRSKSLHVIDFGGGGGHHYTIASNAFNESISLIWNVVETRAMVNESQRLVSGKLKFFSKIDDAVKDLEEVDLVFTSGALQYCPSPLTTLQELTHINAKFLYITRTFFTDSANSADIFSVQVSDLSSNGPGPLPAGYADRKVRYPVTYVSQYRAEAIIEERYRIKFKVIEGKSVYKVGSCGIDEVGYFCIRKF